MAHSVFGLIDTHSTTAEPRCTAVKGLVIQLLKAMEVTHRKATAGATERTGILQQGVLSVGESVDEGEGADDHAPVLDAVGLDDLAPDFAERTHNTILNLLHILTGLDRVRVVDNLPDSIVVVAEQEMGRSVSLKPTDSSLQVFLDPFTGFGGVLVYSSSRPAEIPIVSQMYPVPGGGALDHRHHLVEGVFAGEVAVVVAHRNDIIFTH